MALQTLTTLLYQGILLGLFINGVARWDFDSLLQTTAELRADGRFDSVLPGLLEPVIRVGEGGALSAFFRWEEPPTGMQGISVLVNDVERDRAFFADEGVEGFEWVRHGALEVPEYVRFAFVTEGGRTLDYTAAGTLFGNGSFRMPLTQTAIGSVGD
jgi:hypothetical protein